MVAKEATEDTLAAIRNNPNVIIGEEGKLVVGHGAAQTGFGISDMGEGIHDVCLGFKDVDDEKQQAVRISKKVLGKYEEPLNFAVGAATDQVVVIGQAFYRFPRMGSMTGNTNSSTKKESNSNVTTEKQKSNNNRAEKVVEDTTAVKTVGSNNKNTNNQQKVVLVDKNPKLKYAISIEKKADNGKIYITIHLPYLMNIWWRMEL